MTDLAGVLPPFLLQAAVQYNRVRSYSAAGAEMERAANELYHLELTVPASLANVFSNLLAELLILDNEVRAAGPL